MIYLGYLTANDYNFALTLSNCKDENILFKIGYFIGYCKVKLFGYWCCLVSQPSVNYTMYDK